MNVRVLVADDEPVARAGLRDMLADVGWVTVVAEAENGLAALDAIETVRPELVFLDVQMPGLMGTDVMARATHQPFVVFTTAYAQHAVAGFEMGALDYLLKPFGAERLGKCLDRVRAAFGEPAGPSALGRFAEAMSKGPINRLFVRSGTGILPVMVADVAWFESSGDYVTAHVGRSRYMLHLALSRLEMRLEPAQFVRIHRTHIVNMSHVVAFRRVAGGRFAALMRDASLLPVSRERAKELRLLGV